MLKAHLEDFLLNPELVLFNIDLLDLPRPSLPKNNCSLKKQTLWIVYVNNKLLISI